MKRYLVLLPLLFGLAGMAWAESFVVTDIRVEGLQRISPGSVFNDIPIKVNDRIDQAAIADTSRALFRSGNFDDVQIGRDGDVLVITLVERPSISEINIDGNKAIETDALMDGLKGAGLAVGQVFQRATLEQMRVELQRQYVSQGRYDATIETEIAEQARNRVAVNINISEGSVAAIKHINIVGNSVFNEDDLVDLFELKSSGWLSWITSDDKYSREKLNGDLENLSSYYLDRGYIRFNIDSTQVAITPDRSGVYITVNITEGDKYAVTKVDLSGDIVLSEEEMRRYLLLREGQDFSQVQVTNTEELITQRLGVEGYTFAKVNGIPEINDEDKTVAVKFFIDPGKRTYVRRIEFRGNVKSIDEVLRREMRQMESAPASSALIEQSRVRLERLGFFKEVKTENKEVPGTDDMIDVEYTVEEQSSGSIGASVGYAQDAGLILGANLQQNNFLGTGKQIGIGLNTSQYQSLYSFNYVDPYFTEDGVSRGFTLFYRSTDLEEINVASYTTDTIGGTVSFGYPISETQRLGMSVGVNHTDITAGRGAVQEIKGSPRPIKNTIGYVNQSDLSLTNGWYPLDAIQSPVPDSFFQTGTPDGFLDLYGDVYDNLLLTGSWSQFALNRGQLATRGYSQNLSLQVSTPGSDLEYYKITYNGQIFLPLWRQFTFHLRSDLGYGGGWGDTSELPFYEHFYAGGFRSVRGYKSNTLGPQSTPAQTYRIQNVPVYDANGNVVDVVNDQYVYISCAPTVDGAGVVRCDGPDGEKILVDGVYTNNNGTDPFGGNILVEGSAEVLFPLPFIKDQRSVRSGLFLDFGNVFDTNCKSQQLICSDLDFGELRYSVGFGVTWITGFGPITFSLAKPLNDEREDNTEIFQFSLGQGF
ncbi:MAG: outer membrane protein assembly factor BamA [Gammaproteobacteria bacterium]|nr:outer membrane protein assembly factor BamA [Gammaproteobacteria bacterium]